MTPDSVLTLPMATGESVAGLHGPLPPKIGAVATSFSTADIVAVFPAADPAPLDPAAAAAPAPGALPVVEATVLSAVAALAGASPGVVAEPGVVVSSPAASGTAAVSVPAATSVPVVEVSAMGRPGSAAVSMAEPPHPARRATLAVRAISDRAKPRVAIYASRLRPLVLRMWCGGGAVIAQLIS
ncbi:hypothetical protein GCM10009547_02200 [Sporichthya brevicatena]|uniref:Uncharacterized protein n=1 Tax=Sporichthya brevicatena TaxID=171442 RepID=A0ABN1G4Q9_9ACTN